MLLPLGAHGSPASQLHTSIHRPQVMGKSQIKPRTQIQNLFTE